MVPHVNQISFEKFELLMSIKRVTPSEKPLLEARDDLDPLLVEAIVSQCGVIAAHEEDERKVQEVQEVVSLRNFARNRERRKMRKGAGRGRRLWSNLLVSPNAPK